MTNYGKVTLGVKHACIFFVFFLISLSGMQAQEVNYIVAYGKLKVEWGSTENTLITLYEDEKQIDDYAPQGNGKFQFNLELNHMYMFWFEKPGHVTKKVQFDTHVPASVTEDPEFIPFPDFDFYVTLFESYPEVDTMFFVRPVGKIQYSASINDFDWDKEYTLEIQRHMEEIEQSIRDKRAKKLADEEQREKDAIENAKAAKLAEKEAERKASEEEQAREAAAKEQKKQEAADKLAREEEQREKLKQEALEREKAEKLAEKEAARLAQLEEEQQEKEAQETKKQEAVENLAEQQREEEQAREAAAKEQKKQEAADKLAREEEQREKLKQEALEREKGEKLAEKEAARLAQLEEEQQEKEAQETKKQEAPIPEPVEVERIAVEQQKAPVPTTVAPEAARQKSPIPKRVQSRPAALQVQTVNEPGKTVTRTEVSENGVTLIYLKVVYSWGATFFFIEDENHAYRNISENYYKNKLDLNN